MRIRPDTGFVTSDLGCLEMLRQVSLTWQDKFAKGQVRAALKTIMALSLVQDLKERTEAILGQEEKLQKCRQVGWMVETENALNPSWVYHTWDPEAKKQVVATEHAPLKHAECLRMIDVLVENLPKEGVLTKFSSPKELQESYDVEVIPFTLSLSLESAACHRALKTLSGCAVTKLQASA